MSVIFLPETLKYFNELSTILYEKEYFGFEESALFYVDSLIDDIKNSLHSKPKKAAPAFFNKYGQSMQYATFRKSKTHSGSCFSLFTKAMARFSIWFVISAIIMLYHTYYRE